MNEKQKMNTTYTHTLEAAKKKKQIECIQFDENEIQ